METKAIFTIRFRVNQFMEEYCLLGCVAILSDIFLPTFRKNVLPSSIGSGYKSLSIENNYVV
jgi:hypothetical protein